MDEKIVHVRLSPDEVLRLKKSVLSFQMDILNLVKVKKRYQILRKEGHMLRTQARRSLKNMNSGILLLNKTLPKPQRPKVLNKMERGGKEQLKVDDYNDVNLETQLQEIKRKLDSLS